MAYTSFFRDSDVLDAIGSIVVPWASAQREIKIWDAGCATGEEAYSLAMVFAERLDPFTIRNLRILATDREESSFPQFEAKIARGQYNRQELMWVPEALRSTYFVPLDEEDLFEAVDVLKDCIRYLRHDLLSLEPVEGSFALVVCKNVLMHCPVSHQGLVVDMFHRALRPGGFLAFDRFHPEVYAYQPGPGIQHRLRDGEWLRIGDKDFRVLHTPGHSEDSICLFCPETRDLFTGDTLYRISDTGGSYPACYVRSLMRLRELRPAVIHPGHGETVRTGVEAFIDEVLANVQASALLP